MPIAMHPVPVDRLNLFLLRPCFGQTFVECLASLVDELIALSGTPDGERERQWIPQ
jgi:hypothetical protein